MASVVMQHTAGGYEVPTYPECPFADVHTYRENDFTVFCTLHPAKTRFHSCSANHMGTEYNPEDVKPFECPFGK